MGVTMLILMAIGILVGAVLGLRFKVLVLVPVICVALAIVLVDGIARGDGLWWLALAMVVIATSLQLGYILGIVVRFVLGAVRAPNHGRVSMSTSTEIPGAV
jgi:hypothetical protein